MVHILPDILYIKNLIVSKLQGCCVLKNGTLLFLYFLVTVSVIRIHSDRTENYNVILTLTPFQRWVSVFDWTAWIKETKWKSQSLKWTQLILLWTGYVRSKLYSGISFINISLTEVFDLLRLNLREYIFVMYDFRRIFCCTVAIEWR